MGENICKPQILEGLISRTRKELKLHSNIVFHLSDWQKSKYLTMRSGGEAVGKQALSHAANDREKQRAKFVQMTNAFSL